MTDDIDTIIDEITDKIDEEDTNSLTHNHHNDMLSKLENISTIWEVHDRIKLNPINPGNYRFRSKSIEHDFRLLFSDSIRRNPKQLGK